MAGELSQKLLDTGLYAMQPFAELAVLFVAISFLVGALNEWLPAEKTRRYLSARHGRGYRWRIALCSWFDHDPHRHDAHGERHGHWCRDRAGDWWCRCVTARDDHVETHVPLANPNCLYVLGIRDSDHDRLSRRGLFLTGCRRVFRKDFSRL